jgi:L-alanine-DL-glutamate epimerase-like enolase superfamily enzyme
MQHELVAEPLDPIDGWISPPRAPGLGVEVLEDAVEHYRMDR